MANLLFNSSFRIDDPTSTLQKTGSVAINGYVQPAVVEGWKFLSYPGTPVGQNPPEGTTPPQFAITRVAVTAAENQTTEFDKAKYLRVARTSAGTGRPTESFYGLTHRLTWSGMDKASDSGNLIFSFYAKTDVIGNLGVRINRNYGTGGKGPTQVVEEMAAKEIVNLVPGTYRYTVRVSLPKPGTYTTGTDPYLDILLTVQEGGNQCGKSFALNGTYVSIIQPQLEFASTPFPTAYNQDNPVAIERGVEIKEGRVWKTGAFSNANVADVAAAGTATIYLDGQEEISFFTLQGATTVASAYLGTIISTRGNVTRAVFRHHASVGVGAKNLTFPGDWIWVTAVPASIASAKFGILTLVDVPAAAGGTSSIIAKWETQDVVTFAQLTTDKLGLDTADATRYLEHDGTYYLFAGTSPLKVDEILFSGDVWDDSMMPAMALRTQGTNDPTLAVVFGSGGVRTYSFSGSVSQEVFGSLQLPHSYKQGTDIKPHVHWMPTTTGAGGVVWGLEYSWQNVDGTFSAPTTILTSAVAAGGTAWVHKISSFSDIVGTGKNISSILVFRLYRVVADAGDTYADGAALLGFDLHHLKDTVGSSTATAK